MKSLYDQVSGMCSRLTTRSYSTSFSLGIRCLEKKLRDPICSIYGFVRFADEIVDSFHKYDKRTLLNRYRQDTHLAIQEGISLNPILHSFQSTVNSFNISVTLVDQFLDSMAMDLDHSDFNQQKYEKYILGSAEVVGLMCLKVFCDGDEKRYQKLKPNAMKLGSAFQKINFLRDLKADYDGMGRFYFPNITFADLNEDSKKKIEDDIQEDFRMGIEGIKRLPKSSRWGVYLAYVYYYSLFKKIKKIPCDNVMKQRIRIPNRYKFSLLFYTYFRHQLNII